MAARALLDALLPARSLPSTAARGQLCWAPGKAGVCAGTPGQGGRGATFSVKQNPLSNLHGNSVQGRWKLTLFHFPLVLEPCLKPPLSSFSLSEVPPQLLPPPLLYLPTHLRLSSPQPLASDKLCDNAQPGSCPAVYLLRRYSVYNGKQRHFRTPSDEGVPH